MQFYALLKTSKAKETGGSGHGNNVPRTKEDLPTIHGDVTKNVPMIDE